MKVQIMDYKSRFKLFLPISEESSGHSGKIISVDARAIVTTVGLYKNGSEMPVCILEEEYETKCFDNLSAIIQTFIAEKEVTDVDRIAVAVPGPVLNDQGISARLPWFISGEEIRNTTKIDQVYLLNDLEASAFGLANLDDEYLTPIYEPQERISGNVAILAPGEGLGEAGLFFDGQLLRPFATEGGHSEFSPRTAIEVEFYQYLNKLYGIVSWEYVLSNKGLLNIFRFLRDDKRHPQSEKFIERMRSGEKFNKVIFDAAMEDNEMIATITINTFLEFLAREANSLVLKLKATGGLIIGGEIPIIFKDYIDKERFYQKFLISDKMESLLKNTPIYLLTTERTVMNGAANYAAFS